MRKIRFGQGSTIFLLFFGISLVEAITTHDWARAALWFAFGLAFLLSDNLKRFDN